MLWGHVPATMTSLIRTQQGPFTLEDALPKEEWNPEIIYREVEQWNEILSSKARETCCTFQDEKTSEHVHLMMMMNY